MKINIDDQYNKDLQWVLFELKQEEITGVYSKYRIEFKLNRLDDTEPTIKSQNRILKMLSDMEAVDLSPFYHSNSHWSEALKIQGGSPIGYFIKINQPRFNEAIEELTGQKAFVIKKDLSLKDEIKPNENISSYRIAINKKREVIMNEFFILSRPDFDSENHNFIDYIFKHPDEIVKKSAIEEAIHKKLKKSFHAILSDLGFKNEVRKLFFNVSKTSIQFKNNISTGEAKGMGINIDEMMKQLIDTKRNVEIE